MEEAKQIQPVLNEQQHQQALHMVPPFQPCLGVLPNLLGHFREYAEYCGTSGRIPHTSETMRVLGKGLSVAWSFAQLGKINVVGAEHLLTPGRRLFVFNHTSVFDGIVVYRIMSLRYHAHYMFDRSPMVGNHGWRQIIFGALGAFPVDKKRGKTAIPPAISLLCNSGTVVMFPEGDISKNAKPLDVKPGAVWIARGAYNLQGGGEEPVSIIPGQIEYHKRDDDTAVAGTRGAFIGTRLKWRGGVTLTLHPPIFMHQVAELSDEAVMNLYRTAIFSQNVAA